MAEPVVYPKVYALEFEPVEVKGEKDLLLRMGMAFPGVDDETINWLVETFPDRPELQEFMKDFETSQQRGFEAFESWWVEDELRRRKKIKDPEVGQPHISPTDPRWKGIQTEAEYLKDVGEEGKRWKTKPSFKPTSERDMRVMKGMARGNDLFLFYREHGQLPRHYRSGYGSPAVERPSIYKPFDPSRKELPEGKDPADYTDDELFELLKQHKSRRAKLTEHKSLKEVSKRQEKAAEDIEGAQLRTTNDWIEGKLSPKQYAELIIENSEIQKRKKGIQHVSAPDQDKETIRNLLIQYYAVAGTDMPPFPLLTATPYDDIEEINDMLETPHKFKGAHTVEGIKKNFQQYAERVEKPSLEEYLKQMSTQGEALLLVNKLKNPKTFAELFEAERRIEKLYKDGKISDENKRFLDEMQSTSNARLSRERRIAEAGGLVQFKNKEDEKAATAAATKLLLKNDAKIAELNELRSRVKTAGVLYWMGRDKTVDEARKIVQEEMERITPHFTMQRGVKVPEDWISTAALEVPGLYYENGKLIYDRSKWKALKDALKRQPVGTAYENLVQKYQKEFHILTDPMAADLAKIEPRTPLKEEIKRKAEHLSEDLQFQQHIKKIEATTPIEGNLSWMTRLVFGPVESLVTSAIGNTIFATRDIPADPMQRKIFFNDLQKSGYKFLKEHDEDFDIIDQAIYNIKGYHKGRDLAGIAKVMAGKALGEDKAGLTGLGLSLPLPLTGVGTTLKMLSGFQKTLGKGGQLLGKFGSAQELSDIIKAEGSALSGIGPRLQRAGALLERWSTPRAEFIDRARANQILVRLETGMGKEEAKTAWKEAVDLSYDNVGSNVAESMASVMAGRSSDMAVIKGLFDSEKITVPILQRIALKNPTIAKMWNAAVQRQLEKRGGWTQKGEDLDLLHSVALKELGESIEAKWKTWQSNTKDPLSAANFNKADYVRRVIENMENISKSQKTPWLASEDPLNRSIMDKLFSIMVRDYSIDKTKMNKFWKEISELDAADRNSQKYAEIYASSTGQSLLPWDATVSQWGEALKESLLPVWRDSVNNWMPTATKGNHYGGNTFGWREGVTKKTRQAWKNEYISILGKDQYVVRGDPNARAGRDLLTPAEQIRAAGRTVGRGKDVGPEHLTFQLKNWSRVEDILKDEFRENISIFKGSNIYKDLLADVRNGRPLSESQWETLKSLVQKHLAKKHYDAFDVTSEGDFTKLARTVFGPEPIKVGREVVDPKSEGLYRQFFGGLGPGGFVKVPVGTFVKSVKSAISNTPQPMKSAPLGKSSPAFSEFMNEMHEMALKTDEEFQATIRTLAIKAREEGAKNPLGTAVNVISEDTWQFVRTDFTTQLDMVANRNFGGSYKRMVENNFIKKKGSQESLTPQIERDVKAVMEDPVLQAERMGFDEQQLAKLEEETYKKVAQDYAEWVTKLDIWEGVLGAYYQVDIKALSKDKGQAKKIRRLLQIGEEEVRHKRGAQETLAMRTKASNVYNPTLDNFKILVDKFDKQMPAWFRKEKKLKTPWQQVGEKLGRAHDPTVGMLQALTPWIMGARKSIKGRQAFRNLLDKNPDLTVSYADRPTIARVDPKPLLEGYTELGNNIYDSLITHLGPKEAAKVFRSFLGVKPGSKVAVPQVREPQMTAPQAEPPLLLPEDPQKIRLPTGFEESDLVPSELGKVTPEFKGFPLGYRETRFWELEKAAKQLEAPYLHTYGDRPWHGVRQGRWREPHLRSKQAESVEKLEGATEKDLDLLRDRFIEVFSTGLTASHLGGIERVTVKDMSELASNYYAKGWVMNTAYPDLAGLLGVMRQEVNAVLEPIGKGNTTALKDALKGYPEEVRKQILSEFEKTNENIMTKIMTGGSSAKTPLIGGLQFNIMDNVKRAFDNVMRANGAMVGDNIHDALKQNSVLLHDDGVAEKMLIYGPEMEKMMKSLKEIVNSPFMKSSSDYFKNQGEDGHLLKNLIVSAMDFVRRGSVNGMLGGTVAMGSRYLATNLVTAAPITGNMGKAGLSASLPWGLNPQMHKNAAMINTLPADKLLFTSKDGIPYTAGEIRILMSKHNLGFSQESLHLSKNHAQRLMKETADLVAKDASMPKKMKGMFLKHANPYDFNLFSKIAFATDQQFRSAVFQQALKEGGRTHAQAASLARRSMLDYGAPDKETAAIMSRLTLFWRFRLMMMAETINMTARAIKADRPTAVMAYIKGNFKAQQEAETWLYQDDSVHSRMFLPFKQEWKERMKANDKAVLTVGPFLPQAEAYESMLAALSYPISALFGDSTMDLEEFSSLVIGQHYRPAVNLIARHVEEGFGKKGGVKFRDEYINMFKALGKWEFAKKKWNLEPIPSAERTWTSPVYGPSSEQYRFRSGKEGSTDKMNFAKWQFAALMVGVDRHAREYGMAYMAAQKDKPEVRYRSINKLDALYYMLGQAKVPLTQPGAVGKKALIKFMRDMEALESDYKQGKRRELGMPSYGEKQ